MTYLLRNLTKTYEGKNLFTHMDFPIKQGETTALSGPSGVGKTTLLRIIMGFVLPDEGDLSAIRNLTLSAVFPEDRLCTNLSAWGNVKLVTTKEKATETLTALGLGQSLHLPVRELSTGMKRRVALARALAAPYDLLLLDEPFTGLDQETKGQVIAYTKEMTQGKTVIIVTHDETEAERLGASSRFLLPEGQIK